MILVTGGIGYIGCVVVDELLKRGKKVKIFDKCYFDVEPASGFLDKVELVRGDIRNLDEKVLDGVEAVIHLASLSNDPTAEFDPKANQEINFVGTQKLANLCKKRKIKKFTFASTCAITGFNPDGMVTEDSPVNPQSEYARSKLLAEQALLKLADKDFCPVILRQATVFGFSPRMRWDLVVNTFTKDAFQKGRLTVFHGGDMWRPLVDVHDIARAHIACLEAPDEKVRGEVFHVVHKNFRILELAHWVKEILRPNRQVEVDVVFGASEYRSYKVSADKMQKVLGFTPTVTVEDAVKNIYQILTSGKYNDFDNPKYYNMQWMRLLSDMEERLKLISPVL